MQVRLRIVAMLWMLFLSIPTLLSQYQNNAWFRGTLSIPIHKAFTLDTEVQHRRQSTANTANFVGENLLFSVRSWGHYQHKPNLKFSLSPFAYLTHYKIIQSPEDLLFDPGTEFRFSGAMEIQQALFRNFYIIDRAAVEYRLLRHLNRNVTRFRNRLGLSYVANEQVRFSLSNEFMLNLSGVPITHFFDQNRIGFNVELRLLNNLKLDIGYLHLIRFPFKSETALYENNLSINIVYRIPGKQ